MIAVFPTGQFRKSFQRLPKVIQEKAVRRDKIFQKEPFQQSLETHKLKGNLKKYWSYSVDKHYRVLFRFEKKNLAIYFDIGTHEIYK